MGRFLLIAVIAACCGPTLAFAAFDDVTLTTDAVISVGGYTLNISGSSATIESIVVNANSFSVTLASGSSFTASSPTRNQLSSDVMSTVTSNICTGSASSITLGYSGGGTVTTVITPSATVCSGSSGGGSSSSSGNGAPVSGPLSIGYRSGASANPAIPLPTATSSERTTAPSIVFTRDLRVGTTHADIRELQKYLNRQGFVVAKTGAGSPGKETMTFGALTRIALIKFQEAHAASILTPLGLSKGTGYFGAGTRAFMNSQN